VLEISPEDEMAHNNLGLVLLLAGHRAEAGVHFEQARSIRLRKARAREQAGPPEP